MITIKEINDHSHNYSCSLGIALYGF